MKLGEIRKLCDEATPGPWVHRFGNYGNNHGVFFGKEWQQNIALFVVVAGRGNGGSVEEHTNAAFIAAARDLVPNLLAVAEAALVYKELVLKHYHRKEPEYDPFYFDAAEMALSSVLAALEVEP